MENTIQSKGVIQNLQRIQQTANFINIRFTNSRNTIVSPTDVDMCFDYRKKLNIFVDFKLPNKGLEGGQCYTFTNIVDLLQQGGQINEPDYGAYFMVVEHNTPIDEPLIDASIAQVKRVYYKQKWFSPPPAITLENCLKRIFSKHNLDLEHYKEKTIQEMLNSL